MAAHVNADLVHHFDGSWVNALRMRARTEHFEGFTGQMPEQTLRHLAPGRVAGTKK
jgi:hypothetical protein